MQLMVANAEKERRRFKEALNARVAKDHPAERGRPQWLHRKLNEYRIKTGRKGKVVSIATCGYWLRSEKIARQENATLLCGALGMTRGELYGDSEDPRLAAIVERWGELPEHMKNGMFSMVGVDAPSEPIRPAASKAS